MEADYECEGAADHHLTQAHVKMPTETPKRLQMQIDQWKNIALQNRQRDQLR